MLVISCLVMCAAVFPAFGIARYLEIGWGRAHVLAAAAGFLPHTFYAATYMTETLQYPLFLTAFLLILRWLDSPSRPLDLLLGFALGCTLLTKVQGLQLVGAFLATLIVYVARAGGKRRTAFCHAALVIAVTAAMGGAWITYKAARGASAAGVVYERALGAGLIHWTWRLAAAYWADFALAPGLITLMPLLLWVWATRKKNFVRVFFICATLLIQIVVVSTVDGGLTGWLRERLFLYSLPLVGIIATRGLEGLTEKGRRSLAVASIATTPVLLAVLMLYPFHVSSVIEIPWANALGSMRNGFEAFSKWDLVAVSLAAMIAGAVVVAVSKQQAPSWFAVFLLAFHGCGFVASSRGLAGWSRMRQPAIADVIGWLSAHHVPMGGRLLVAGRHDFFEGTAPCASPDAAFLSQTESLGLTAPLEWQIEIGGRYDVRMVASPKELMCEGRNGDYLLSSTTLSGLEPIDTHAPLRLYRVGFGPQRELPRYVPERHVIEQAQTALSADTPQALANKTDSQGAGCYVDLINGEPPSDKVKVEAGASLQFAGWAADLKSGTVPQWVGIELVPAGATHYFALAEREDRPDVATAFSKPALRRAGFAITTSTQGVPPGLYALRIRQAEGARGLQCDPGKTVEIRSATTGR
jgi:hypothetical protein